MNNPLPPRPPGRPPAPGAPPRSAPAPGAPPSGTRASARPTNQSGGSSERLLPWRKRARTGFRILWVLWALFWLAGGIGAAVEDAPVDSAASTAAFIAFAAAFGLAPLLCHLWWSRRNPIVAPVTAGGPRTQAERLRLKLVQVTEAADELKARQWSSSQDHKAICQRVERLHELVSADEQSVQRGGRVSPIIEPEIDQLRDRVLGILDAAINGAAVAPGDAELDNRLQMQLDELHARQHAINEVEGRPQPGY